MGWRRQAQQEAEGVLGLGNAVLQVLQAGLGLAKGSFGLGHCCGVGHACGQHGLHGVEGLAVFVHRFFCDAILLVEHQEGVVVPGHGGYQLCPDGLAVGLVVLKDGRGLALGIGQGVEYVDLPTGIDACAVGPLGLAEGETAHASFGGKVEGGNVGEPRRFKGGFGFLDLPPCGLQVSVAGQRGVDQDLELRIREQVLPGHLCYRSGVL